MKTLSTFTLIVTIACFLALAYNSTTHESEVSIGDIVEKANADAEAHDAKPAKKHEWTQAEKDAAIIYLFGKE